MHCDMYLTCLVFIMLCICVSWNLIVFCIYSAVFILGCVFIGLCVCVVYLSRSIYCAVYIIGLCIVCSLLCHAFFK